MQNRQKALPIATAKGGDIPSSIRPRPPANFWAKFDAEVAEAFAEPPSGSFTIRSYSEHAGITDSVARRRIERLERNKKIKCVGRFGDRNARHYIMMEDA